jgi:hypothetical protein
MAGERAQASHGAGQAREARARAEAAARQLGFPTVAAYLRDRQGWPRTPIRRELGAGERVLRRLMEASGVGESKGR